MPIKQGVNYAGIERLVRDYSGELVKRHEVAVWGHEESAFPEGVELFPCQPASDMAVAEVQAYRRFQPVLRDFDVIHDFSHLHISSRLNANLPSLNIFWHAPALAKYPKAPYNIIALSGWAEREFQRVYQQGARYQESIAIDKSLYHPRGKRGDRFLAIGRNDPEKGNLNAITVCLEAGVPLDVIGARGMQHKDAPLTDYEKQVMALSDGKQIIFHGDLPEGPKIKLMQSCKALIYITDHPEVTSHKIQEAMFCGAPVIAPNLGGIREIVSQGADGWLCQTRQDFLTAIGKVGELQPESTHKALVSKYSIERVVKEYEPLYKQVAEGLRW